MHELRNRNSMKDERTLCAHLRVPTWWLAVSVQLAKTDFLYDVSVSARRCSTSSSSDKSFKFHIFLLVRQCLCVSSLSLCKRLKSSFLFRCRLWLLQVNTNLPFCLLRLFHGLYAINVRAVAPINSHSHTHTPTRCKRSLTWQDRLNTQSCFLCTAQRMSNMHGA